MARGEGKERHGRVGGGVEDGAEVGGGGGCFLVSVMRAGVYVGFVGGVRGGGRAWPSALL
ncbi:hypothetical protein B1218_37850 [Pseudomonas ogarae]|nr:hypothetical protein B1218_37850 [Pseudomonas ogarae]